MAYRINGVIRLADNGDANLGVVTATNINSTGVATATEFDGKVSEKAITEQTEGDETDVTGADELLIYDQQTDSLLRVSVDDFISASGIGTLVSNFTHVDSNSLVVSGLSTLGGVEIGAGIITASSPTGIVTFYGDGSNLTNLTSANLVGALPAISGANLTDLPGSPSGPAAAEADKLLLVARDTTNATHYLTFATARTGQQTQYTDTGLTYNPSTNTISATFSGNGSALTSLNASNLGSGTVPDARFPATLPAADGSNLTNLTSGNLVGALPAIDGSALLNLPGGGGGAPGAATIAVTDDSSDTSNFLVFTNAATGNQAPKTGTNLTLTHLLDG